MTRGKAGQTSSVSFAGVDTLVDTLTAYKQAANSSDVRGDVVVQKQRLAIVDRRAPVTAKPASLFWCLDQLDLHPHKRHKIQIFLAGHHQGACRLTSTGLHRIDSVSGRCRMWRNRAKDVRRHR